MRAASRPCRSSRRASAACPCTGVSGFIDATGKIYAQTELGRPATLLEEVSLLEGWTVYRELGDVFAYLVLAALAFAIGEAAARARRERAAEASRRS